jgi:spore germination protein KA
MNEVFYNHVREKLKDSFDVQYRVVGYTSGEVTIVYIDNLCDSKFISEHIITPFVTNIYRIDDIQTVKTRLLTSNSLGEVMTREEAVANIVAGNVVLFFSNLYDVLYCEAKGFSTRSIDVPKTEAVLKGPREGLTENISDNMAMIRRKIKHSDLKFESFTVGQKSNTTVVISYIKNVAPEELLNMLRNTIVTMKDEFVLDTNYIEEQLGGKKSPFDTVGHTEKPDIAAANIMEGRIAVLVDGTPFIITIPFFFIENFQTPDDYYLNKFYGNAARWLRWSAFLISTFLPGLYVALVTYHFPLIPSVFVFRLAVSRAGVPFPTVVEVFLMIVFFQLIKEAGVRLPQPIGQAMSIVGALILGDAATGAGLASQTTVLVIALSSICFFLIPKLYAGMSLWSLILLLFGSTLGLPGFYIGFFLFITHLASLRTNGYPFLYPLGTLHMIKYKDLMRRGNLKEISNNIFDEDDAK